MRKYISREAAIEVAKKIFKNASEKSLSVQEIYTNWGRDLSNLENNRKWLSGKLKDLKAHRLVSPIYSYENGIKRLENVQLTQDGIEELNKAEKNIGNDSSIILPGSSKEMPLDDIMKKIAQLKRNHPEYEITFDVKLKDSVELPGMN